MPLFRPRSVPAAARLGLALAFAISQAWAAPPSAVTLDAGWQVRLVPGQEQAKTYPKAAAWLPAQVPGAVQTDLIAAKIVPDPFYRDNEGRIQWAGLSDWQYQTHFNVDAATLKREHVELVFDGLDTFAEVTLNGKQLLSADNMFRQWRVDAKSLLKRGDNVLEVKLYSPIKKIQPWLAKQPYALPGAYDSAFGDEPEARHSSTYVRKAPYNFGWDWGPRMVNAGIWKDVRVEAWDAVRVDGLHIAQQRVDAESAQLQAQLELQAGRSGPVQVTLDVLGPDGRTSASSPRTRWSTLVRTASLWPCASPSPSAGFRPVTARKTATPSWPACATPMATANRSSVSPACVRWSCAAKKTRSARAWRS